jgi:hypothetical protein
MKRFAVVLAAILAFAWTAGAAEKISEPEALIRGIYAEYSSDHWPTNPEKETFSPDLWKQWKEVADAAEKADDVGVDFDVFLDAQDTDTVTNVSTKFTPAGVDKGSVAITFTAFATESHIDFAMIKTAKGWKIDNITWQRADDQGGASDLRAELAQIKKDQSEPD